MKTNEQHLQSILTAKGFDITVEQVRTILDEVHQLADDADMTLDEAYFAAERFWEAEAEVVHIPSDGEIDDVLFALFGIPGEDDYYVIDVGEDARAGENEAALFIKTSEGEDVGELLWNTKHNRPDQVFYKD